MRIIRIVGRIKFSQSMVTMPTIICGARLIGRTKLYRTGTHYYLTSCVYFGRSHNSLSKPAAAAAAARQRRDKRENGMNGSVQWAKAAKQ